MKGEWKEMTHDQRMEAADELLAYAVEVLNADRPTLADRESAQRMVENVRRLLHFLRGEIAKPEDEEKASLATALLNEKAETEKLRRQFEVLQESAFFALETLEMGQLDQTGCHLRAIYRMVQGARDEASAPEGSVLCPECKAMVQPRATLQDGKVIVGSCGHAFKA
jgi:hypothetical protein